MLNFSQSRHQVGTRSKVHALVFTLLSKAIKWNIRNTFLKVMGNWIKNRFVAKYSLSPDYDNRWCSGGSVNQIITESRLNSINILNAIKRVSDERDKRVELIKKEIPLY